MDKKTLHQISYDVGAETDLRELLQVRKASYLNILKEQAIFYVEEYPQIEEFLNYSFDGFEKPYLLNDSYVIPVFSSLNRVIFWMSYSPNRPANQKYFKVMPSDLPHTFVYGMDTLPLALEKDYLVWVEGVFDALRLQSEGIPAVATLGTYENAYFKVLSSRVSRNVLVPDNDKVRQDGRLPFSKKFWSQLKQSLHQTVLYPISSQYKDIDEMEERDFQLFCRGLKELVGGKEDGNERV